MQVAWGNVRFPANGVEVTSNLSVVASDQRGMPLRYLVAYNCHAWVDGAGQADLSAKELAFRNALINNPKQDFILYQDNGSPSSAAIISAKTATGTRCISLATPEAQGGEFVTRRTLDFVITAEFDVVNSAGAVVEWRETVSIQGTGGPRRVWRFPINGPGIRQVVSPFSLVRVVQSGDAIGYKKRPPVPPQKFPQYLVSESYALNSTSPKFLGNEYVDFGVSWSYTFERGDGTLFAFPSNPPGSI